MIKKLDEYIDGMYSYITSLDDLKFYQNDENIGDMLKHITRTAALCILLDLDEIVMKQMRTVDDENEVYDMIKYQTMYISGATLIEHLRKYANSIKTGDSLDTYYQLVTSISDDIQQTKYISDLTGLCMRTISSLERMIQMTSNDKKYIMTNETTECDGHILHRIVAIKNISRDVHQGYLGGWIESEKNLSQDGKCWVDENAMVFGDAIVKGDAQIKNAAIVKGSAIVSGDAWVCESAVVSGNATVMTDARVRGRSRVYDMASIRNGATICGDAQIFNNAMVKDNAIIMGNAMIYDNAIVGGTVVVENNACICNRTELGGNIEVIDDTSERINGEFHTILTIRTYNKYSGNDKKDEQ